MSEEKTKELPLKHLHEKAGARFGAFAGWNMPLTYPLGVLKEHLHTREKAGLFDISHMQLFEMQGANVEKALAHCCPIDPALIAVNECKYTFLLNDKAGIIDDLIVTRYAADRFIIVSNASRADVDQSHFESAAKAHGCSLKVLERVFIAVQGPSAIQAVIAAGLDVSGMTFMHGREFAGDIIATRSGYTGEDGLEIAVPIETASGLVEKLLAHPDVEWIGLAARDSLRLEAGLCLYGNDLDEQTDPISASLLWAIPKSIRETGTFVGAQAFRAMLAKGSDIKRVGLKPDGRQPVRSGTPILDADGETVGIVTSGGFGPSVSHPVAMGYVDKSAIAATTPLFAKVRDNTIALSIAPLPFAPHQYVKG
ncbi:MAG: glycine cleavage system aminomethyltransferase GcvT [Rhizobiaceae bacterium]